MNDRLFIINVISCSLITSRSVLFLYFISFIVVVVKLRSSAHLTCDRADPSDDHLGEGDIDIVDF